MIHALHVVPDYLLAFVEGLAQPSAVTRTHLAVVLSVSAFVLLGRRSGAICAMCAAPRRFKSAVVAVTDTLYFHASYIPKKPFAARLSCINSFLRNIIRLSSNLFHSVV